MRAFLTKDTQLAGLCFLLAFVPGAGNARGETGIVWENVAGRWEAQHPVLKPTGRANVSRVEKYTRMSDEELRRRIDENGSFNRENIEIKNAVYDVAARYHETGDKQYAHKAAVILLRFSEVINKWPFNNWQSGDRNKRTPHNGKPPYYGSFWENGWWFYDLESSAALVKAYDLIYSSGAMESLGKDAKKRIEKDLLYYNLKIHWDYMPRSRGGPVLTYGNTSANRINGCIIWGLCLADPELVHKGVRWMKNIYRVGYYADGSWHETPTGYHLMTSCRLEGRILNSPLKGYSDPPGYKDPVDATRFDNVDMAKELAYYMDKAADVARHMVLPNGRFVAIHDSTWNSNSATESSGGHMMVKVKDYVPSESRPYILYWFGHGILGRGRGADQVQAHLHFSGTHGHEHLDCLNIGLFAKGKELFAETHYRGSGRSTRAWQASTAGHNTVVIDEGNQHHRGSGARYRKTDLALDGVPDIPHFRIGTSHGGTFQHGNLLLWEPNYDPVQVAVAEGENSWHPNRPKLYRRTLAMIASRGADVYLVDIFRVDGGKLHDWILHGNLEEEYKLETGLTLEDKQGKIHEYIGQLKSAGTPGPVEVKFVSPSGANVRTLLMPTAGTEVIVGQGPAMRREGDAYFLDVRRKGPANVFAAVHEPYRGAPLIKKVTDLRPQGGGFSVVLKVELGERTDYILSTLGPSETISVMDDNQRLALTGRFGFISMSGGQVKRQYLVDGTRLEAAGRSVEARSYEGTVTGTNRRIEGEDSDSLVVSGALPEGDVLKGRTILLTDGEGSTHGFEIVKVKRAGDRTIVHLPSDPAIRVGNGVMKMMYFPHWGVKGEVRYHVPGVALEEH